ncbi:Rv1476 family membrane protein [Mycolicibacterium confluentis]|uniref:Uncharacterized protein n=1 Tax=Mycolicibacterium confluentis TaxID=28047 RepID=A0A7I7XXC2_9MYCO|nr:DUF6676 family protein [Mycolicibacterium confluentis]MCV7318550.1 hypothetical protein [Mycolicibacterium confluentis]ORV23797.1 hypothetical protein AWB99_23490 [Mycolicibacterium confluentis]BBZ33907.1 hypothetical protein MCNF_25120 [Mycolicibacterium confluentis]
MTAPQTIPHLPSFIPYELCTTVGVVPDPPEAVDQCMDLVQADVAKGGVSARGVTEEQFAQLQQVVSDARADGIDLKIVVIDGNPYIDTPLRDIATEVGQANPGSTVLALSPSFAGTYSPTFDRVTLEAGEDLAKTGNPVQSAQNFVGELHTPDFPWMTWTIGLTLGVLIAAVATRLLQRRAKAAYASNVQAQNTSADPS